MAQHRPYRSLTALLAGVFLLLCGWPATGEVTGGGAQGPPRSWVGSWASVPTSTPATATTQLRDETIRQVVHTSIAGDQLRLRLTNEFGEQPLHIGEVRVALRLPARTDPVVSIYLPETTPVTTVHAFSYQENVLAEGNVTADRSVTAIEKLTQWYFLSGVSVRAHGRHAEAVVALGDSITDGSETTLNANHRWPDVLAQRLRGVGVLNAGIAGNRLLHDPNPPPGSEAENYAAFFGQSALRRFDRDVLAHPGVRHVVVLLGVNDLGHPGTTAPPSETVTAAEIVGAHRQLIARAHTAGLRVYGGTILPFKGDTLGFYSPENEAKRQAVNHWIRTSGEYDAVIDFDRVMRDPADPLRLRSEYDSGDHLHPNDAGMAAMAAAIPVRLFR
jgi:lysophospholipase L1-like esterase